MLPKSQEAFRLVHISDIHFRVFPWNPLSCFNKRLKGLLRQVFSPIDFHASTICKRFPDLLHDLQADSVCLTGDLTLTALDAEFLLARYCVDRLSKYARIYVLPGNHDVYTQKALREQTFYHYFPDIQLQKEKLSINRLTKHWWLVLLDCSCLNGWFAANGAIQQTQISNLEDFLRTLPTNENVIIANHYPLLPSKKKAHDLINHKLLQRALKNYPNVHLYLHGHEHQAAVYNNKGFSPSLILNSGSVSLPSNARFHILDLYPRSYLAYTAVFTNLLKYEEPLKISIKTSLQS
ncbi:metallophosphoesterase [Chlamydia sp. 17-3921]|uniref:metallophosphoesterase family protein n=1 Tax=Chlamydia sp. 17-3921 TaxID=2675798 RepID=UPI001918831F|nr:metallophosphoesterase [Chlamydia sp. 17-3921]